MDLGFTRNDLYRDAIGGGETSDCSIAPVWQDLTVRLSSAWTARRALLAIAGNHSPRCGNFDPASADALTGFNYASRAVNPTASGNRKPAAGIDMCVAGNSESGARG